MVDVDVQGTSTITMICRVRPRDHGQRNMQVDDFRRSKLWEAWKFKHMKTGKAVMWCGINFNKFATQPKDTPDPSITNIKNPLKSGLGKKLS